MGVDSSILSQLRTVLTLLSTFLSPATFSQRMAQSISAAPPLEWQHFILRSDFTSICYFLHWQASFADLLFTLDFRKICRPTFMNLISQTNYESLIKCGGILRRAPDSIGKQYVMQLLSKHLAAIEVDSLSYNSLGEATAMISLIWEYVPAQRPALLESLPAILPAQDNWHQDENFLQAARPLFLILTNPAAPQDIVRRLVHASNNAAIATLITRASTLDLFLYYWNFYTLWYQLHSQTDQPFAEFLDDTIQETVTKETTRRFLLDERDIDNIDNLIMLIGFLYFIRLALEPIDENLWRVNLPPMGEMIKHASHKTFIPAVFFLFGLEWLYDRHIWQNVWDWVLPKADEYTNSTAVLDYMHRLVSDRAKR